MPPFQTHQLVECLSYHGVKSRTLDYGCSREGFFGVKSRTLGLFTPCRSISKHIEILRGKKSQGKVSRGKESQGKGSRGKKSLHQSALAWNSVYRSVLERPNSDLTRKMSHFKDEIKKLLSSKQN